MNADLDPEELDRMVARQVANLPPLPLPGESGVLGVHAVNWRQLDDDQARETWLTLRAWVEWFTVRYNVPVSIVPACWWKHGALVEELSALHFAHIAAFDPADSGTGPISWHERLAQAQTRMQRAGSGCTSGHFELKPRSWDGGTDEAEWDAWIDQSHAR